MDKRDRELLANLARVNTEIGEVTLQLLTLQTSDEHYAAGLRRLGRDLVQIGAALARRAGQLDGAVNDPAELLSSDRSPSDDQ